ncbi:MAG: glutaredoxin family protein [Acidobacteria bacterium]|nr:glutaredoxin family protein [Acidobacteriota bacterium]MBI3662106.1 glutaredoxin family protein [Acidobacteriota bacterium]
MTKPQITMYTTAWCGDCDRAKQFLKERGVEYYEVNIDETPDAEELVLRANNDRRKVPTFEVNGRYFSCSPFDPYKLSEELNIPLNP